MNNQALIHGAILLGHQALLQNQMASALVRRRRQRRRRRTPRSWCVRPWLTHARRLQFGVYRQLMQELRLEDEGAFFNCMRMEPTMFDVLLQRVGPRITKANTNCRESLEPGFKLAVTLRYLATGEKYPALQYSYRASHSTISLFVPEVCQAIRDEYKDEVMKCSNSPQEWQPITD